MINFSVKGRYTFQNLILPYRTELPLSPIFYILIPTKNYLKIPEYTFWQLMFQILAVYQLSLVLLVH